jgi:hypothetical protein
LDWAAAPYDQAAGGHERNYSSPLHVTSTACARVPLDAPVQLLLRFDNRARNLHLQGARWTRDGDPACDFGLKLLLRPIAVGAEWWQAVPSGLHTMAPQEPASATVRDLRSGHPRSTSRVLLGLPLAAQPGSALVGAALRFRYLVGYSAAGAGARAEECPRFRLMARPVAQGGPDEAREDCAAADKPSQPAATVLYVSDHFAPLPYSYGRGTGGSPTGYSPPIAARSPGQQLPPLRAGDDDLWQSESPGSVGLPWEAAVQLELEFENGCCNMHLQGGDWQSDADTPCELGIQLRVRRLRGPLGAGAEAAALAPRQTALEIAVGGLELCRGDHSSQGSAPCACGRWHASR